MERLQRLSFQHTAIAAVFVAALLLGVAALGPYLSGVDAGDPDAFNGTTATIVDGQSGEPLGEFELVLAETRDERYIGLSDTESLPEDRGMLFVYDSVGERTYVMRDMSFGLDIIFIAADGTITSIHDAPEPPPGSDGTDQEYTGSGQYVLEVNRNWTDDRGIRIGDRVEIDWAD